MPKMTMIVLLRRDSGPLDLCSDGLNAPELQAQDREARGIFKQLSSTDTRGTVESSPFNYHYCLGENVCFMTVAEKSFSKKIAFTFLDELQKEFMSQFGHQVANETRPYAYMAFEKFLKQTKERFTSPEAQRNLDQLGSELKDVRNIMSSNIKDVLNRGEKLQKVQADSQQLVEDSKLYKKSATSLNRWLWLRQMAPAGFVLAIVGGFFYLFYFR